LTGQPKTESAGQITAVGAVYDLIWHLEMPPFRANEPLDELVVRGLLMALASYLNHQQLKVRKYHVYPSDELLAIQIGRSSKTVARVLDYLLRTELIVLVRAELRPGRGRTGRPPIYSLPIDVWRRWPRRVIRRSRDHGSDTGVQTITAETPVANGSDTGVQNEVFADTGVQATATVRTPVSTEPGHSGNPATTKNPANEPVHARARARHIDQDGATFQITLPGQAAVALSGFNLSPALTEGQHIWGAARQELFRAGQNQTLEQRLRNTGTAGYDPASGVLTLDGDLGAEDLEPGSAVLTAVERAAGRQLKVELVGGAATRRMPPATQRPANDLKRTQGASASPGEWDSASQADDAADRRTRYEQSLSVEDFALLQELERKRLAYVEGVDRADMVDAAAAMNAPANPIDDATTETERTSGAKVDTDDRAAAPRKRRKKELVA
jgi:hypothetical protein